jgi:hypothetical protein
MSTDFSQKERAFVAALAEETGRDLEAWMAAIAASGLAHRNDIIDWLRQQGFTFSNASWIERIHHNGGRLIYGATDAAPEAPNRKPRPVTPTAPRVAVQPAASGGAAAVERDIDAVLAAAKAYRPLAQVLLRDALAAVPGADARGTGGLIVLSHSHAFAAIEPTPKDVRLSLAAGAEPLGPPWVKAKRASAMDSLAGLTHMLVLTDARQLNRELTGLIVASARATR